jgi:hypothetical protein
MKREDFIFKKTDALYGDYWFDIVGDTAGELTDRYMEQSMVGVTVAVFSIQDGQWGIRRQFPFNYDVITPDDDELYELLKSVAYERFKENRKREVIT